MKLLISAAETSADQHGARALEALRSQERQVDIIGIGGEQLSSLGLKPLVPFSWLKAMGFLELLFALPRLAITYRRLLRAAKKERPDVALLIDFPTFHMILGKRLRKLGIPVYQLIPPKTWASRKRRMFQFKKCFDRIGVIFPFEKEFYAKHGIEVDYVGNPLCEALPSPDERNAARERLGLRDQDFLVTIFPGSRSFEIRNHLPPLMDAVMRLDKKWRDPQGRMLRFLFVTPERMGSEETDILKGYPIAFAKHFQIRNGISQDALLAADLGWIKSGTSTLEAALLKTPHIVFYRPTALTTFIVHHVFRYWGPVALSNLVYRFQTETRDRELFPELIGSEVTGANIIHHTKKMLLNQGSFEKAFGEIRKKVLPDSNESASDRVAKGLIKLASSVSVRESFRTSLVSLLWSSINRVAIPLVRSSKKSLGEKTRVISVGNLQAGGAGKTPLVASLAKEALDRGLKVAIATRGYRSRFEHKTRAILPTDEDIWAEDVGDEVKWLRDQLPDCAFAVGKDRLASLQEVRKRYGDLDLVILDDAFQNDGIQKSMNVLLATDRTPSEAPFREFFSAVKRADVVIQTKGKIPDGFRRKVSDTKRPLLSAEYALLWRKEPDSKSLMVISGVGDPDSVEKSLLGAGFHVKEHIRLKDHQWPSARDCEDWVAEAKRRGLALCVTGKDYVKWTELSLRDSLLSDVYVFDAHLSFEKGDQIWDQLLSQDASSFRSSKG